MRVGILILMRSLWGGTHKCTQAEEEGSLDTYSKATVHFWVVRQAGIEPATSRTATGRSIH